MSTADRRPWLRLYSDLLNHPKVQTLSDALFRAYINTLCIAGANDPRGTLPPLDTYAFLLRVSKKQAEKIRNSLKISELLDQNGDDFFVHNWDKKQFESDNVTLRTQRHREKRERSRNVARNGGGNVPETPPESESETETDINIVVVKSSGLPDVRDTTTTGQFFFELTPERMALAQARGFGDALWVQQETAEFIRVNMGKPSFRNPNATWLKWLSAGQQHGIGNGNGKTGKGRTTTTEVYQSIGREVV